MPRIIAGKARGTQLVAPAGQSTRPTSDRTKEALFSILAPRLPGVRFLDLFAGSGQVGLEALSRGAEQAVFVERDRRALEAIRTNIAKTHVEDDARLLPLEAGAALRRLAAEVEAGQGRPFDIIFLDPPYAEAIAFLENLSRLMVLPGKSTATPGTASTVDGQTAAAETADAGSEDGAADARFAAAPESANAAYLLAPDGILVLEHESRQEPPATVTFLQLSRSCKYGTAMLSFYKIRQKDDHA